MFMAVTLPHVFCAGKRKIALTARKYFSKVGRMTGTELRVALRHLSIKQYEFAERVGYRREAVSRWVRDRHPIPQPVAMIVEGWLAEMDRANA